MFGAGGMILATGHETPLSCTAARYTSRVAHGE
ncbi:hypothetical protein R52603_04306 [Paraburkholderia saeva]|uniref:Uncharacterized protein n=1 Tax=Paraburkholderia saeva TaxID=2777537 RepID=A0A9N8X5F1_9BURK|nr:hypothetical protein R52603_04306 [Paraburkholderia saeva]CAG4918607.1 hypothetical protein R70241_04664 [Paraburkholderia saeva]CAG4922296.1 hypothetical protein LMG31841_05175 [Paraburkholderia saeva]